MVSSSGSSEDEEEEQEDKYHQKNGSLRLLRPSCDEAHVNWMHNGDFGDCKKTCEAGQPRDKPRQLNVGEVSLYETL